MSTTHRDSDKFILRLPDGMREAIKSAAKANRRSMTAEINARLIDQSAMRDDFAKAALPAIIAATSAGQHMPVMQKGDEHIRFAIARDAYDMADAMLKARG